MNRPTKPPRVTGLSRHKATVEPVEPSSSVDIEPAAPHDSEVEFDSNVHGTIVSDDTGKNVYVRDESASDDISELKVLDDWTPEEGESDGSDPYNTGGSKSDAWISRYRR